MAIGVLMPAYAQEERFAEPGSVTFTVSGSFVVPRYKEFLQIEVYGGGGGRRYGGSGKRGTDGGASRCLEMTANGGSTTTLGGSASGGDINIRGQNGTEGTEGYDGQPGKGGKSGGPLSYGDGANGFCFYPSPYDTQYASCYNGGGGAGYCLKTYNRGELEPDIAILFTVGLGGVIGSGSQRTNSGAVIFTWS